MPQTEAWLRGPIDGVIPELVPAAHIMIQASEELAPAVDRLSTGQLLQRPGGAASIEFHLRHIVGSIDRLLTYARGEGLSEVQRREAAAEKEPQPDATADELLHRVRQAIDHTVGVYRSTKRETLFEKRTVGRAQLPSDVIGLLYHVAAHTLRHTGQVIATSKVIKEGEV